MRVLIDGLMVLMKYLYPIGVLFTASAGLGLGLALFLPSIKKTPAIQQFCLCFPLGLIPLSIFSFIDFQISRLWEPMRWVGNTIIYLLAILSLAWFIMQNLNKQRTRKEFLTIFGVMLGFLLFLVLRLAFVKNLLLPPYHDSITHYQIIEGLLDLEPSSGYIPDNYFHIGFHAIVGSWIGITHISIAAAISLFGQLILVMVPFGVFSLVLAICKRYRTAVMAALISSFVWQMPQYAANWGKYPAMTAIILLPVLVACLLVVLRSGLNRTSVKWNIFIFGLLAAGIAFLHTRAILCVITGIICIFVDWILLRKLSIKFQRGFALIALVFAVFIFLSYPSLIWTYTRPIALYFLAWAAIIVTLYFCPRILFSMSLFTLLAFLLVILPVPAFFHISSETWLDEPFLEILMFIPLSILPAIGFDSGMMQLQHSKWLKMVSLVCLAVWLAVCGLSQPWQPDNCCNYASDEDLHIFTWISGNTPEGASIAIPGKVNIDHKEGTDAGIWIPIFGKREVIMLQYDTTWFQAKFHDQICSRGEVYIFSGHSPLSFQIDGITHPEWYELSFQEGRDAIYRVIGCER